MSRPNLIGVPSLLRQRAKWVIWRYETRNGKATKVPYNPRTGERASSTDPATWATFDQAVAVHEENGGTNGVGYVLTKDDCITGVDLDHCCDPQSGAIEQWARKIIADLHSYTEITPSGKGVRVYVKGNLPPGGRKKGKIEMYDTARYFTVTGDHLEGTPATIEERGDELKELHARVFGEPRKNGKHRTNSGISNGSLNLSDAEIIEKARKAANGAKFEKLWCGDWSAYPSRSEADLALCSLLAFWTGGDAERADRLFRESGLYREKWDEPHYSDGRTYGEATIAEALHGGQEPRWQTASEFVAAPSEDVGWIWHGYLAPENVTLLSSRPKCGKTTVAFHLLAALLNERDFLGQSTRRVKALLLSEEPSNLVRRRLVNLKLQRDDLLIVKRSDIRDWNDALGVTDEAIRSQGVGLVIVDTLGSFCGIDQENEAGRVLAALQPMLTLAQKTGAAVLLLHHLRKSPGDEGTASRGSSAFAGAADVILELYRDGHVTSRRRLTAYSRYDETPHELLIELGDQGYRLVGTPADIEEEGVRRRVLDVLPQAPPGKTQDETRAAMNPPPAKGKVSSVLNALFKEGSVERSGKGVKGDAYHYRRPSTDLLSTPAPDEPMQRGNRNGRHA